MERAVDDGPRSREAYNSSKGMSGVMTKPPLPTVAVLFGFGAEAGEGIIFAGGGACLSSFPFRV